LNAAGGSDLTSDQRAIIAARYGEFLKGGREKQREAGQHGTNGESGNPFAEPTPIAQKS
jgi:hypothetical protein